MMDYPKMNFHTHTTYCDGKESAENMVLAAIEKGFTRLGFSGHSYTAYDESYCMKKEEVSKYIEEVRALKEKYKHQIEIFCGVEQDYGSNYTTEPFDYVIGSVHAVEKNGIYYSVDDTASEFQRSVDEGFGGDVYAFIEEFYRCEANVVEKTNADIIGHFDLITKFNENHEFFDPENKRYHDAAMEALCTLVKYEKPFEINTGGMYRGLRSKPYPSIDLLKELYQRGAKVMLSSDSHDGKSIGYQFEMVTKVIKEIGFDRVTIFGEDGFKEQKI